VKISTFLASHFRVTAGLLASGLALLSACSYTQERIPEPICTSIPAVVSYQTDVLPILKTRCYRCHSAANYNNASPLGSGGALNMESFSELKSWTQPFGGGPSYIVGSIRQLPGYNQMPYDGKEGPDACEIATIKAWVDAGAPNN
jgi:hypothetical protein